MSKHISFETLRAAEIAAENRNIHISRCIKPDGGELEIVSRRMAMSLVKKRPINSHKGTFGTLVAITGSDRFPGASNISCLAALRSGVGLVKVFSTESACRSLACNAIEATLVPCPSDADGFMLPVGCMTEEIIRSLGRASAVLIGCGLGKTEGTFKILETVIENANCPIIIDADGINLVCTRIELLRKARTEVILTPHPAELSRLAGVSLDEAIRKRYQIARQLSNKFGITVAAKSCATIIVSRQGSSVTMFGNDGLAKGGSGDLLAGLTASFAAQGLSPANASILGSAILGIACERVSKRLSKTGMLASDIINYLPELFKKFERA